MNNEIDPTARARQGRENFLKGYNCTQSVLKVFEDIIAERGGDMASLMRAASSFGGGMGRMRLTCGAVSALAMLAGLELGSDTPPALADKTRNYELVQHLAAKFKVENDSLICSELLGLRTGKIDSPKPTERTAEYYRSRPCPALIACACRIYAEHLNQL